MNPFDMPIISARQVWHLSTYTPSGEWMPEHVDTYGKRMLPGYESGLKRTIDSLPEHLRIMGNYFWSAQVEGSPDDRARYYAFTTYHLQVRILETDKPKAWKARAMKLAMYAVNEVRHQNPPDMSGERRSLYQSQFLAEKAGVPLTQFRRDAGEHWDWSISLLDKWVGQALGPVAKWIDVKKEAAA